ncbi:uncharacterized protein EDB91DRAFT_1249814 [Suillus paluster]|uniref:uncharacterized protein n=1 Tax=Suillus paluster TaxID=48578 RepID=UPI001B87CC8C|nr:uncharacterized protein EDB91DRAFT_1249814 [Suillus paluster]KAG1736844.1 hypothetical protein EDB91DRAFT_1249814 [Suillus paluster]
MVYKVALDTIVKARMSADEATTEALNLSMIGTMTAIPVPGVQDGKDSEETTHLSKL